MAEQLYPETYPFMSKETFDQVSDVMWGRYVYEYYTCYIDSRAEWNDEDIREEALYAMGLAHGLRLAALENTSQPTGYQYGYRDQYSALSDEGGYQLGCTSQCDPRFGRHYHYTPHVPQSMAQTPLSPPPRPVLSFSELVRTPSESAALQRQDSMSDDRSAPRQDGRDYANGNFGTERPHAETFSSSQQTPFLDENNQNSYIPYLYDLYVGMAHQPSYNQPMETEVPGMRLPGNLEAFHHPGEGIAAVSGAPTNSDGRNVGPSSSVQSSERESSEREGSGTENEDWVDLGTN